MKKAKLGEEKRFSAPEGTCSRAVESTCYWARTPRCYLALRANCTKDAGSKTRSLWYVRRQSNDITICSSFSISDCSKATYDHHLLAFSSLGPANHSSVPTQSIINMWEVLVETANWKKWLRSTWSWSRTTWTPLGLRFLARLVTFFWR